MHALQRKLLRDSWHFRGQLGAIAAVVACGIALFVTLRSMNGYLRGSRDRFYREYRFADVFARLERAPVGVLTLLARIPGVATVNGRVVHEVALDVRGLREPAMGRLVSIPVPRAPALDDLHLASGRWPDPTRPSEVIASTAFAVANALVPGDSVGAVMNGHWEWLHVVGTAVSPEYVYEVDAGAVFPDNRRFGVLWMGEPALARAYDLQGAFNDVTVRLAPGAVEAEVIAAMDRILRPYGGVGAYGRARQTSHQFLSGEIEETQVTSVLLPAVFLGVTVFLLHIVLSRLVGTQREQVATLEAFGYGTPAVARHYLSFAFVPIALGGLVGTAVGLVFARQLAGVYGRFFHFPAAPFVPDWRVVAAGVLIAGGAGLLGAATAVWHTATLPPAEAMRPPTPPRFRLGTLDRLPLVGRLPQSVRMITRNLERHPGKAALVIIGIALAGGLVTTTLALFDATDFLKELEFHHIMRDDVTVMFAEARPPSSVGELRRLPGVLAAEPFRAVPVRMNAPGRSYQTALVALAPQGDLRRIVDRRFRRVRPPLDGVVLSAILARVLRVGVGDSVEIEVLEGRRPRRVAQVAVIVDDLFGTQAFMDAAALRRLVGTGTEISGAHLAVDPRETDELYFRLKHMPAVAGVGVRSVELRGFERTIAESFSISLYTAAGFACVIAFGVVYNSARIALSERGRELASLRVLGFSRAEVTRMLLGEQAVLTVLALPFGVGVTYTLCWLLTTRFSSELFRLPVIVRPRSVLIGFGVILTSAMLSAIAVRARVARLDLVEVLKTRE